jgi:TRAP-type C4-dicarboxylate transport system permease small subunit
MAEDDKHDSGDAGPPAGEGPPGKAGKQEPASWANPLHKADVAWTKFETWLATVVLALEIFALSLWVLLKGMSTPPGSESPAGTVFRAIFGAVALGLIPYLALRSKGPIAQRWGATVGIALGIFLARFWVSVGVDYTSNLLNWYQQASTLTLFGGLRGIGTRLTLLLALLGGSLATAKGKHITIDLVTRFVNERIRLPIVVVGWVGAAIICLAASWGFFDHIAIENFGAKADATAGEKVHRVAEELGEHAFMLRKQIALDFKSTPHIVFGGEPYAEWLTAEEWNQWIVDAGFQERYGAAYETMRIPEGEKRAPMIIIPGKGEPRGELVHAANLVFPIGLLIIALRFLLRSLLALSRHVSVDPEDEDEFASDAAKGSA